MLSGSWDMLVDRVAFTAEINNIIILRILSLEWRKDNVTRAPNFREEFETVDVL